ncbi:MAG: ribose 5-phosphate isomerase B [Candidatus Sericytochromatia bacterium]|uniref:Ribose 5-phosphate isomerase B n=1 Tax=Candidatus Tanganyikabacteria bacterium TaxID=2961651 RepID=A0A937X2C7_9BACT|nr:ribose 5-phosphate isomerase B [Candidatus Tanganyikabacteria bacterium]
MKIVIASDHGGFSLKQNLVAFLQEQRHEVLDFGCHSESPVDYPDFAFLVAAAVASGQADRGIIVDGAGIGSSIVANKVPGIRAALCNDLFAARNAREHNNANILTLGGRVIGPGLAAEIVKVFCTTEFATRHQPRIDKISQFEEDVLRAAAAGGRSR